jgi:hypothetical protein
MLIGFTGKKYAGKDTAGAVLGKCGFNHISFATPMKYYVGVLLSALGYSNEDCDAYTDGAKKQEIVPELGVTPRHMLQSLGTDWGRDLINPDLWVKLLVGRVKQAPEEDFYVTDVRFHNEADLIRASGGKVVRIVNPNTADDCFSSHASERDIPNLATDYPDIINDSDIKTLHGKVVKMMLHFDKGL